MDLNDQVQPIVAALVEDLKGSIEQELKKRVSDEVIRLIASDHIKEVAATIIQQEVEKRTEHFDFENNSRQQFRDLLDQLIIKLDKQFIDQATNQVNHEIAKAVAQFDSRSIINETVKNYVASQLTEFTFPQNSIPAASINFKNFKFNGDVVKGGIIEQFGSTGIEDLATKIQLTVMDTAAVFEQGLHTPSLNVKRDAVIDRNLTVKGDLIIEGSIPVESTAFQDLLEHTIIKTSAQLKKDLDDDWFKSYSKNRFETINENGLELNKITRDGKPIIDGNQLGYHIVDSNLKRVGQLTDLQTLGDTYLSETLFTAGKRVGVNTMEPAASLAVWDEEVEIVVSKKKQDTGYIGTQRRQSVIIGSNNQENIVCDPEGRVTIKHLKIGNNPISSEPSLPKIQSVKGHVVFNSEPDIGRPVGWICLGGSRWAEFGKIA